MSSDLPKDWTDEDQDDLDEGRTSWDRRKPRRTEDYGERLKEGFDILDLDADN
jgi:hypothetical protein